MGFWLTLLLFSAMTVLSDLLMPKPEIENAKPVGLGDFQFPTSTEARALPLVWGTAPIKGPNLLWYGDLVQTPITEKIKTGMFRSQKVIRGYTYSIGVQFAACRGVVDELVQFDVGEDVVFRSDGIHGVTINGAGTGYSKGDVVTLTAGTFTRAARVKITKTFLGVVLAIELEDVGEYSVLPGSTSGTTGGSGSGLSLNVASGAITHGETFPINRPNLFGGNELGNGGIGGTLQFFSGTADQAVSSYLEPFQLVPAVTGDAPAYRDTCYLAPVGGPLYLGNSTTIKPWRLVVRRTPNPLALTSDRHIVNGRDANPANVLYEVLTSEEYGCGIDSGDIDTAGFVTAANTLHSEGNGFSMLLDRQEDIGDMVRRLEQQIDAVVFFDATAGLWRIKLVRDDYDAETVPAITEGTNLVELSSYSAGTFEGTKNQVRTPFVDPEDNYKETFGLAQDMANRLTVGRVTTTSISHPGCKNRTLANALAWREIRTVAYPLKAATVVVTRDLYGVLPGDVVTLTLSRDIVLDALPMRVRHADYGELLDNRITLELTEDVFRATAGVFADPPSTGWTRPSADVEAIPADEQVVIEAPRALNLRDSEGVAPIDDRLFVAARRQASEALIEITTRSSAGVPSGGFDIAGEVYGFVEIGELASSLSVGSAYPLSSLDITPGASTQTELLEAFSDFGSAFGAVELGTDLPTLCLVGSEFFLVASATDTGANVRLSTVYRGVLDSVQEEHAAGAPVYLLFAGAGRSANAFTPGHNVDVRLLPTSATDRVDSGDAVEVEIVMDNRSRRPYAPASFDINGTRLDTTNVDLDASGSGEDVGVFIDEVVRRDFRTTDEVSALLADAETTVVDFPAANATTIELRARNGGTTLATVTGISGTSGTIRQLDILQGLDTTSLPASLSFGVRQSHTFEGVVLGSRAWLEVTSTIVSDMVGKHAFGVLDDSETSTAYAVQVGDGGTDHVFALSTAFTLGDVEYRINGGSWTTLIAAGGTGGTIPNASINDGDTIEVRHTSNDVAPQKLLRMTVGGTLEAYAVLIS